jgi:hypothetical protein
MFDSSRPGQLGEARVGEAHHLERAQPSSVTGRPSRRTWSSVSTISRMRARNHGSKRVTAAMASSTARGAWPAR